MNASIYPTIYPTLDQLPSAAADRRQLAVLLDKTVDAVPDNSALYQLPAIANVLVGEMLGAATRTGILPKSAHASTLIACRDALLRLPETTSVASFRTAAKETLKAALREVF